MKYKIINNHILLFLLVCVNTVALGQNKPGTIVFHKTDFNVPSGNVYDVLEQIPQVEVSDEGTVSILGSGGAQVLIDNKEASPDGDYQSILEQLSVSMIERIEITTSPSAKNDAEAGGGVVNIVLAGDGLEGYNGNVSTRIATGEKYATNAGINYITGKWNIKVDALAQQYKTNTTNNIYSEHYLPEDTIATTQQIINDVLVRRINTSASVSYELNDYHKLRLATVLGARKVSIDNDITSESTEDDYNYAFINKKNNKGGNGRLTLDYTGLLSKEDSLEKEISANASYFVSDAQNHKNIQLEYNDVTHNDYLNANAQVDYMQELKNNSQFETGIRSYIRNTQMDYNRDSVSYEGSVTPITEDKFDFNENVYAGYLQLTSNLKNFDINVGLRTEYSQVEGIQVLLDESFRKKYWHFFPSIQFSRAIVENHKLTLNYSKSIKRPYIFQMNPFINDANPNNLQYGNPDLKPALTDKIELKYEGQKELNRFTTPGKSYNHNWFFSINFNNTNDHIYRAALASEEQDGVIENSYYNLKKRYDLGLNGLYSTHLFAWWKLDFIPAFRHIYQDGTNINKDIESSTDFFQFRLNSNVDMWKGSRLIVSSFYRTAFNSPQGRVEEFGRTNFTLRQLLFNDKLTLTLLAKDPFGQTKIYRYIRQTDFIQDREFEFEASIFELSLRYNFGELNTSKENNKKSNLNILE